MRILELRCCKVQGPVFGDLACVIGRRGKIVAGCWGPRRLGSKYEHQQQKRLHAPRASPAFHTTPPGASSRSLASSFLQCALVLDYRSLRRQLQRMHGIESRPGCLRMRSPPPRSTSTTTTRSLLP